MVASSAGIQGIVNGPSCTRPLISLELPFSKRATGAEEEGGGWAVSTAALCFHSLRACVLMAAFGLNLDSPLLPNVDAYINPAKDEDVHRNALNAVVSTALVGQTTAVLAVW